MDTINKRIEVVISTHNLTASSFADQIGVQRSSVSHVLSGRNKPSITFIEKVISTFPKVDAQWLITGKQQESQPTEEKHKKERNRETQSLNSDKSIEKIVVFYADKTFESYQP